MRTSTIGSTCPASVPGATVGGVRVLAHRGSHEVMRENTLGAFAEAFRLGADGVELDVRSSLDGALVVHHDAAIEGLGPISRCRLEDLPGYVPSLEAALEACGDGYVNIEIKSDPSETGFDPKESTARRAARLCATRRSQARGGRLLISSFSRAALLAVRDVDTSLDLAWLVGPFSGGLSSLDLVSSAAGEGYEGLHVFHQMVDTSLALASRQAGLALRAWTVDDGRRVGELAALGLEAVVTNDVPTALSALGRVRL